MERDFRLKLTSALCLVSDLKSNSTQATRRTLECKRIPDHLRPLKCSLLFSHWLLGSLHKVMQFCTLGKKYPVLLLSHSPSPTLTKLPGAPTLDLVLQCANTLLHEHLSDKLPAIHVFTLFRSNAKTCMRKVKLAITPIKHLNDNGKAPFSKSNTRVSLGWDTWKGPCYNMSLTMRQSSVQVQLQGKKSVKEKGVVAKGQELWDCTCPKQGSKTLSL